MKDSNLTVCLKETRAATANFFGNTAIKISLVNCSRANDGQKSARLKEKKFLR